MTLGRTYLLFTIIFISFSHTIKAQAEKEEFDSPLVFKSSLVGGAIGIALDKDELDIDNLNSSDLDLESKNNSFSFSPYYAKAIKENTFLGARLTFSRNYTESIDNDEFERDFTENISNSYGVGVFGRKYISLIKRFGCFLNPELSYFYQTSTREFKRFEQQTDVLLLESFSETNADILSVDVEAGLYFLINEKLSVETNIGSIDYSYSIFNSINNDESTLKQNSSNFNLSLTNILTINRIFAINYFF